MRHVLRDRRRLADSRLHLDPGAGRRFGLERTGEQMLGAAHRHTDAKKWHAACAQPLIQDERDELVYHCVPVITPSAGQDRSSRSARAYRVLTVRAVTIELFFHFIILALRPYFSISL